MRAGQPRNTRDTSAQRCAALEAEFAARCAASGRQLLTLPFDTQQAECIPRPPAKRQSCRSSHMAAAGLAAIHGYRQCELPSFLPTQWRVSGIFFTVVPGKRKKRTAPQAPAGGREGMGREKEGIGRKKEGLDNPASARCAVARSGSLAMDYAPCGGVRRQCYALLLRDESLSELAPPLQASAPKALRGAQRPGRGRACTQMMTRARSC